MDSVGGIRTAIEKLSFQPTLITGGKTYVSLNNDNNNDPADSRTGKNTKTKLAHISITFQDNGSTDQPTNDKTIANISYKQKLPLTNCSRLIKCFWLIMKDL